MHVYMYIHKYICIWFTFAISMKLICFKGLEVCFTFLIMKAIDVHCRKYKKF